MLNSGLEPADTTAIRPSDVLPSACSCQTKAVDEEENKAVKPQGLLSEGAILVPSQSVAQEALPSAVKQLGCSCGGGQPPQIVYALGSLWFDFGTEARYDAIVQQLGDPIRANNPPELFGFLRSNPQFLAGITFILMQDQIPLYAIQPVALSHYKLTRPCSMRWKHRLLIVARSKGSRFQAISAGRRG